LEQLRTFLHQHLFRSARDVFEDIADFLPTLARDLKKAEPSLELNVDGFHVKDQAEDVMRNIFIHLLRNSMDHGIEPVDERLRRQKDPKGRIRISMERRADQVLIIFEDDGRGLNVARIRDLALDSQLIASADSKDPRKVAELIFDAGLSTSRQVTDISGRGIGMNAVRRFAQDRGGDVLLRLDQESPRESGYWRFQFHIVLPDRFFETEDWSRDQSVA
jgi:chemotaxis protein histidine kinase CheA